MSERILNVAIIGAGAIAHKHATGYLSCNNVNLASVIDIDPVAALGFAKKWNIPRWSTDVHSLPKEVELVSVCTPVGAHKSVAVQCLRQGKHVLCEKPLATNLLDGQQMVDESIRTNCIVGVGFHQRYHPLLIALRKLVKDGVLGQIHLIHFHKSYDYEAVRLRPPSWYIDPDLAGGGAIFEFASHQFDYIKYLISPDTIQSVQAQKSNRINGLTVDDHGAAILTSYNGTIISLDFTWKNIKGHDSFIEVYGDRGMCKYSSYDADYAQLQLYTQSPLKNTDFGDKVILTNQQSYTFAQNMRLQYSFTQKEDIHPIILEVIDFVQCIRNKNNHKFLCGADDALESLKLNLAAQKSAINSGKVIYLNDYS